MVTVPLTKLNRRITMEYWFGFWFGLEFRFTLSAIFIEYRFSSWQYFIEYCAMKRVNYIQLNF